MDDLDASIRRVFAETWELEKGSSAPTLTSDTILLESGLDSLGFAIFVSALEEELGYDPFTLATDAYYPQTYEEFVTFYRQHRPRQA